VRLEEPRFGGSHGRGDLIPDFLDVLSGAQQGDVEPFNFLIDGCRGDLLPRDLPAGLPHPQDAGMGHAIRNRDTAVGACSRTGCWLSHGGEHIGRRVVAGTLFVSEALRV